MSYEKFITDFLNIKPSDLDKISTSTRSDGSVFIRIRLVPKSILCPFYKNTVKVNSYYDRKLTYETKINIQKDLKHPEETYSSVSSRYNTSTNKVIRIFDNHVEIPRKKLPEVLSIDEHYFPALDLSAKHCCFLMDFVTSKMVDVLPDRMKAYLIQYFSILKHDTFNFTTNTSELDNVKFVSIDMYENFRDISRTHFPNTKVCTDSFYVLKHLTDDFRKVRIRCQNSTENPTLKYLLVKFRRAFDHKYQELLDNVPRYNKKLEQYINYRGIRDILFENFPILKVAFDLKEYYIKLNIQTTLQTAPVRIDEANSIFGNCGIAEYEEFHLLLVNWREEIINSFTIVEGKRINNSYMESKNRLVSRLIYNANGFKNFKRTRNRILFCLNPNDSFKF